MCTILEAMMREGASHIEVIAEIGIFFRSHNKQALFHLLDMLSYSSPPITSEVVN